MTRRRFFLPSTRHFMIFEKKATLDADVMPTKNDQAHYQTGTARRELLDEVHEYLSEIPNGDLEVAKRALETIRGPVMQRDLRYAAGRFYVLQVDGLWVMDNEENTATGGLLQDWCDVECRTLDSLDKSLRAAWAANEAAGGDEAWREVYDKVRDRFKATRKYWRTRVQARQNRDRMLKDLKELRAVQVPGGPDSFDADPDSLAVLNGLVDLRTGAIRPLRPSDMVTQRVGIELREGASAPQWEAFLRQVLITDGEDPQPDDELISWVQKLIGYAITGHATEQMFAVLYGSGANGKGVFLETLAELFDPVTKTIQMSTLEHKAGSAGGGAASGDLARLSGARMVLGSEGEVGVRLSASLIKRLTGQDTITARHLYRPEFEFRPRFTLMLATNTRPAVLDASEGYWRRVRLVPFRRFFAPKDRDLRLTDRLRAELPGILRWALDGAQRWYAEGGLGSPAVITNETDAYRADSDRLAEFMRERLEIDGEHLHVATKQAVWLAYVEWASDNKEEKPMARSVFMAAIGERPGVKSAVLDGRNVLRGVRLRSSQEVKQQEVAADKAARRRG